MLKWVEYLHFMWIIHRDIKPSNFTIGPPGRHSHRIFIIDFGLAEEYIDKKGEHKNYRDNRKMVGNNEFCSRNNHF